MVLTIDNITLTPVCEADADELFSLTEKNRTYLREWMPWLDMVRSVDDSMAFIMRGTKHNTAGTEQHRTIRTDGELVGIIGLHHISSEESTPAIGYWVDKDHQGQGIVSRACKRLVQYCFEELKLDALQISCATDNKKSQKIPISLGFEFEKRINEAENLYGKMVDHEVFILQRPDIR